MAQPENQLDNANHVEYITPKFLLHNFETTINEQKVVFQVLKMKDSVLIFVNDKNHMQLNNMYVALQCSLGGQFIGTNLCGFNLEQGLSEGLPLRLSKKLGKPVYFTCNLKDNQNSLYQIETRINEEIKDRPEMF